MMDLLFDDHGLDAIVCLNGNIADPATFEHFADIPLIAADGAASALVAAGVVPEFVVGDLDSIDHDVLDILQGTSEFVVEPDQESNDFEKSLRFAGGQLWTRLLVVGMHGGDLEHSLNNWSVLMRYARSMHITVLDRERIAVPVWTSFRYHPSPNELLSIIPQPAVRLTTSGLLWELDDALITLGEREGARNRALGDVVDITVHHGSFLFFCDARLPATPIFRSRVD